MSELMEVAYPEAAPPKPCPNCGTQGYEWARCSRCTEAAPPSAAPTLVPLDVAVAIVRQKVTELYEMGEVCRLLRAAASGYANADAALRAASSGEPSGLCGSCRAPVYGKPNFCSNCGYLKPYGDGARQSAYAYDENDSSWQLIRSQVCNCGASCRCELVDSLQMSSKCCVHGEAACRSKE